MKTKFTKLIAAITVLAFLTSIPLAVYAKPGNGNSGNKNAPSVGLSKDKGQENSNSVNKPKNPGVKDNKGKNTKNPFIPKNNWDKQLTGTEKKLSDIEKGVNDIKTKIDKYTSTLTLPVTPSTSSSANVSVTDYVYSGQGNLTIDVKGFVMGTAGKLKALSNRLSVVNKELKLLEKRISKDAADKYKELTAKAAAIKDSITSQIKRLQTMLPSNTTTNTNTTNTTNTTTTAK